MSVSTLVHNDGMDHAGYERLAVAILGNRTAPQAERDCRPKAQRPKAQWSPFEKFATKFTISPDGCWEWTDTPTHYGYGRLAIDGRQKLAHRLAYEFWYGPIPEGLFIDHICRNRLCIRPSHLEPVTNQENVRRGYAFLVTHCKNGHELAGDNLIKSARCRSCRLCHNARCREKARQKKSVEKACA